jgi:hypothetical protein
LAEVLAGASARRIGQRTSLIIITPNVDGDWIEALWPLLRRGTIPTVLLLDPVSFAETAPDGLNDVAGNVNVCSELLSELGITYYVITRDLLDRPESRPGRQGWWEWRVSPLGRAVTSRHPRELTWKVLS